MPAASETRSPRFEVRFEGGRTSFEQGEPIGLELVFSSQQPDRYRLDAATYDRSGRLQLDRFVLLPAAPDPLSDWFDTMMGITGGIRHMPVLGPSPVVVRRDLLEHAQLAPGDYTLVVETDRVDSNDGQVPLASAPVRFRVTPMDPVWADLVAEEAARIIDTSPDEDARRSAARKLRFLGTERAAREMAARLGQRDPGSTNFELTFGLVGSPHRQLVMTLLEQALGDPLRPVDAQMVRVLTLLRAKALRPEPVGPWPTDPALQPAWQEAWTAWRTHWSKIEGQVAAQLAEALPTKLPAARAVCVEALHQLSWKGEIAEPVPDLRAVLLQLDPLRQQHILDHDWLSVEDRSLLPWLTSLLRAGDTPEYLRAAALGRVIELDPSLGRAMVLEELALPTPRVGTWAMDRLRSLPDETLPGLEPMLAARLRSAPSERDLYAIERYATDSLAGSVEALLSRDPGGLSQGLLEPGIAYLLRVRPEAGERLLREILSTPELRRRHARLLLPIGTLEPSPALEAVAIALLDDPEPSVAASAADALKAHGGAQAEAALWRRLERFHAEWGPRKDDLRPQRVGDNPNWPQVLLETSLWGALGRGRGWWLDAAGADRLARLVVSEHGADQVRFVRVEAPYVVQPHLSRGGQVEIRLAQYELRSLDELRLKLQQLPAGSVLRLQRWVEGPAREEALVQAVRQEIAAAGHRLSEN